MNKILIISNVLLLLIFGGLYSYLKNEYTHEQQVYGALNQSENNLRKVLQKNDDNIKFANLKQKYVNNLKKLINKKEVKRTALINALINKEEAEIQFYNRITVDNK